MTAVDFSFPKSIPSSQKPAPILKKEKEILVVFIHSSLN